MGCVVLLLACVAVILLMFWFYENYFKEDRIATYIDKLPGSRRLPIIGTVYTLIFVKREDLFDFVQERFNFYKGIFRTWFGSVPVVHVCKPEHVEVILNNSVHITKSSAYDVLKPWLGDGLLLNNGLKWHIQRKLLTPAFHFNLLENALETFLEKSICLVDILSKKADGGVFDIYPLITHCTLDVIYETAMGTEINSMLEPNSKYVNAIYEISDITTQRIIKPWLHPDFIFYNTSRGRRFQRNLSILHRTTEQIIKEKKSKIDDVVIQNSDINRLKGLSFIDILIEASKTNPTFTDKYIRDEIDTFLFEGHDTTTANICWTLFLLGNHLDIQEKVYEEIISVCPDSNLSIGCLGNLKLMERCMKESLRLYPSVPVIGRMLAEDIVLDDYLIPANCTANLYVFQIHRDEKYFPDPEKFKPDRFLPENLKGRHPYAFIPFSAGPRNCIGQKYAVLEEKVILSYILRNFRVKAVDTQATIKPLIELILRPLNGIRITLHAR